MQFPLVGRNISLTDLQPGAARAIPTGGKKYPADRFTSGGRSVRFPLVRLKFPLIELQPGDSPCGSCWWNSNSR